MHLRFGFQSLAVLLIILYTQPATAQTCPGKRDRAGEPKIVGGWKARISQWPGQAGLRLKTPKLRQATYMCGGVAVAPLWVLTAAHCFDHLKRNAQGSYVNKEGEVLDIVLGTDQLMRLDRGNIHVVAKVILHPAYKTQKATKGNDIALIKLTKPWDGPVARLSLLLASDGDDTGRAMVAGFGLTHDMIT